MEKRFRLFLLLVLLMTAVTGAWAQVFRLPTVRQMENSRQLSITDMPKRANGLSRAPVQDDHGIITTPDEGVTKYYTRAGISFYASNGGVYNENQSGIVTILEAEGGKVYIKDPVSHYAQNSWVEGTRDGNTITVATGQPLLWNANYSTTLSLNWGNVQARQSGNTYLRGEGDITFTVDDEAGTITLNGSSSDKIIGVFWDDDNSWSGYGDHGTVWTYDTNYQPASTDPIVLPDGAEVQNWYADGAGSTAVPTDVKVAFVGNEVYISGLTSNFPDAWIKGTIDGTTVTFSKFQFVGIYNSTMPIWAVGADSNTGGLQEFTMTYNSEAKTLTLDANQQLVFNAAEDRMYYLSYIESLTIYAEEPVPPVIETLPYVNTFDTPAEQKQFTIIDANEDGRTWNWYSSQGRYTYHQTNAGDDWLVSPGINLVAGKKYSFSIDAHAQTSSYSERLEVKMAKEGTAAALAAGAQLIESTVTNSAQYITLSNSEFTVSETGQYRIGIHAISDQDKYYLYVDNFKVDMLVSPTYAITFTAANANTIEADKWTVKVGEGEAQAFPVERLEGGEKITVTYTGTKKIIGVKAEKKAAAPAYTLLSAATAEDIGKVVCAAGHLHDAKTAVPDGCTAVGILGKVTETGHGLILALKEASEQEWNTINGWTSASYAGTTLKVLPDEAARGSNLTSYTTLGETTVSNWAVAQIADYDAIFKNLGSTRSDSGNMLYDDNVNAYITTGVGGTAFSGEYWTAAEINDDNGLSYTNEGWCAGDKIHTKKIRPVLGF